MKMIRSLFALCALSVFPTNAYAEETDHPRTASNYAELQSRTIKSLSEQDIKDILHGKGWGLALPAELNGLPGPIHLLEWKNDLELSSSQISKIKSIYEDMRKDAIEAGKKFIAAELAISKYFEGEDRDNVHMQFLLNRSAMAHANLRYVHLSRHLMTPELLTQDQVRRYAILRGYSNNPCAHGPEEHSEQSRHQHNDC